MTSVQHKLYRTALRIGRGWSVGGATWLYCPPSTADNVITQAGVWSDGTRTLYIVDERLIQYGQPSPPTPAGASVWRLIAPVDTSIATGGIVISGSQCFTIGPLEFDQGYPTGIVERTTAPSVRTVPRSRARQGLQIGMRIGF